MATVQNDSVALLQAAGSGTVDNTLSSSNSDITIDSDGTLNNAGGGQVTITGLGFSGDLNATNGASWNANITGQPSDASISNANISINANGTLTGAGTGQVTIGGLGFVGDLNATAGATWGSNISNLPINLSDINSTEGTKLAGIAVGATAGAIWGTNISNLPVNLSVINSTEGTKLAGISVGATVGAVWDTNITGQPTASTILNVNISINANGTLSGAGAGQVTITGLGYSGDLNATNGATIGSNLGGTFTSGNIDTFMPGNTIDTVQLVDSCVNEIYSFYNSGNVNVSDSSSTSTSTGYEQISGSAAQIATLTPQNNDSVSHTFPVEFECFYSWFSTWASQSAIISVFIDTVFSFSISLTGPRGNSQDTTVRLAFELTLTASQSKTVEVWLELANNGTSTSYTVTAKNRYLRAWINRDK